MCAMASDTTKHEPEHKPTPEHEHKAKPAGGGDDMNDAARAELARREGTGT